ncbi:uncharacterized protein PV09_09687 [Verruconis gallopava]|uniref:EthD domain-containing protein n=1 Tax=Verruconis gallopava TaxID=253628 RepID=A0A0D1X904_9PEZI|nr:uncharacterized protein PV09_09687 [Verruconis gallopava]KIV98510.1 hypothetical protein PV09_09687 [Verruconis gallopava]
MSAKPYLKISLFIKKLPQISAEQFRAHWKGQHVDIAKANKTFMKNVRKYNQVHILPELKELARAFGQPTIDADGVAEVWVDNLDAWKEIASDEEFITKILPDEKLFLQHPIAIMLSQDHLVISEKD